MSRRVVLLSLCVTWGVAFWLGMHGGLALVVDPKNGLKHCVDRLAQYLGFAQGSDIAMVATFLSVVLTLALPFLIVAIIMVPVIVRWRSRRQTSL